MFPQLSRKCSRCFHIFSLAHRDEEDELVVVAEVVVVVEVDVVVFTREKSRGARNTRNIDPSHGSMRA